MQTASTAFDRLADPVKRWVWQQGWTELRDVQEHAIPAILDGGDVILAARTASGKTEAAFLPLISRIFARADIGRTGFDVVYVSPLKALINDQFRRLEPLLEICEIPLHRWHGDVAASAKRRARERPQGIVLITPESLEATLVRRGGEADRLFGSLGAIVIDELHAFIGTERGRQLQSILNRIEIIAGRERIDRIGLSATLGDMRLAAEELRPGAGDAVVIVESREGQQELLLQVRGYVQPPEPTGRRKSGKPDHDGAPHAQPIDAISEHLFKVLRGKRNLVFGGSRQNVEVYTDRLRELAEGSGLPNEFFAHHGNLSKSERETLEVRLRDDPRPTTAVATSTLELGIDIGEVESVAQIGPGWSVASVRQRLGRSGRRPGKPAIFRMYVIEKELLPGLHPADSLRLDLVQAIAMIDLLSAKWCEPPRASGLHLSTLTQQILAIILQTGGLRPDSAWQVLCSRGPFRTVDRGLFVELLKAIARPESGLVEMAPDGTLMLGPVGEQLTESYDFYAVFSTEEEFRIIADGKNLGTYPLDKTLAAGQTIIFGGRRWRIKVVDRRARVIEVEPTKAALPPRFTGEGSGLHDRIASAMRARLADTDVPEFLDTQGRELLEEGRKAFFELGLDRRTVIEIGTDCIVFPWMGSIKLETLAFALMARNFRASTSRHIIEVQNCSAGDLIGTMQEIAGSPPPAAETLAKSAAPVFREKYDQFLTEELLIRSVAVERLDAAALPMIARRVLEQIE